MSVDIPDRQAITFGEAATKWLQWFDGTTRGPNRKHSDSSYRSRESYLRIRLLPRFGHVKLTELAPLIQDFIDELKLELEGGTVHDIFGAIASICTFARKRLGVPTPTRLMAWMLTCQKSGADQWSRFRSSRTCIRS